MGGETPSSDVKRVEMTSPVSTRPALVPLQLVERYQSNGWTLVPEPKPTRRKMSEPTDE